MIAYALEAAEESGLFDKIHVSTDSDEIRRVVEMLGFPVEFMRPAELADDFTGLGVDSETHHRIGLVAQAGKQPLLVRTDRQR